MRFQSSAGRSTSNRRAAAGAMSDSGRYQVRTVAPGCAAARRGDDRDNGDHGFLRFRAGSQRAFSGAAAATGGARIGDFGHAGSNGDTRWACVTGAAILNEPKGHAAALGEATPLQEVANRSLRPAKRSSTI